MSEADEKPPPEEKHDDSDNSVDVQERAKKLYRGEILAPMVRASTTPLRTLALKYGADAVYTEEMIDRSITGTVRVENKELGTIDYIRDMTNAGGKTKRRLAKEGSGPPVLVRIASQVEGGKLICQIGSGEPELALAAALHVHQGDVGGFDINMGCPKKFSVSGGMGSALLSDPDRACRIIRTLRDNLPLKPISAKIRLLPSGKAKKNGVAPPDIPKTLDFINALIERGGANAVAIHGRTVGHDATIPADWEALEEVVIQTKTKHPHIPILVNGDFYTRHEFTNFMERTSADGVLLGRPALYNTSIFRKPPSQQTTTHTNGSTLPEDAIYGYKSPLLLDKTTVIQEYLREAVRYDVHFRNVKYVLCEMMNNRRAPSYRVPFMPQDYPGDQTINKICSSQSMEQFCVDWGMDYKSTLESTRYTSNIQSTTDQETALAGEHRYEDDYLLKNMGPDAASKEKDEKRPASSDNPPIKRPRVASS